MASSSGSTTSSNTMESNNFVMAITCPICLDIFKDPRNLRACSHTLCLECLKKLPITGTGAHTGWIECPVCRVRSAVGADGVTNYQVNTVARQIAEMMAKHTTRSSSSSSSSSSTCNHIVVAEVKTECQHCNKQFCASCRLVHMEVLKQQIIEIRQKWKTSRQSSVDESLAKLTQKMDNEVKNVETELATVISGIIDKLKHSLVERGKLLVSTANSACSAKMVKIREAVDVASADLKSSHGKHLVEQVERLSNVSVLNLDLDDVAVLHSLVSLANNEVLELEAGDSSSPKITLKVDQQTTVDAATALAGELKFGSISFATSSTVASTDEPTASCQGVANGVDSQTPTAIQAAARQISRTEKVETNSLEVRTLATIYLGDIGIKYPAGVCYLSLTRRLMVPCVYEAIHLIDDPFDDSRQRAVKLNVFDPTSGNNQRGHHPNNRNDRRDREVVQTGGRVVAFNEQVFILENSKSRIVALELVGNRISGRSVEVIASGATYHGLAINPVRQELYTCHDDMLVMFNLNRETSIQVKATCTVLPDAKVLGASESFGVVYRQPYKEFSEDNNLKRLHFKRWPAGSLPARTLGPDEANGFDLGSPIKGPCESVEFDPKGNMLIADIYETAIRIYSRPDANGKVAWTHCCFVEEDIEYGFAPIALTVVDWLSHHRVEHDSESLSPDFCHVAVLDEASQQMMLLLLPCC